MMDRDKLRPHIATEIPGPNTKAWIEYHKRYSPETTYVEEFVWDRLRPALGPWVHDPDGNLWLDFAGHVAVNTLGYNHPDLINIQTQQASFFPDRYAGTDFVMAYGPSPDKCLFPTPSHLHQLVDNITPGEFTHSFFVNSGAEAVENAIKLAWAYKKNYGYGICFDGAFHGRTLGALSLNRSKHVQRRWYPEIPKILTAKYNDWDWDVNLRVDPDEIAFVLVEPMQGEGGYILAEKEFMEITRKFTEEHDIPLIIDEIQTGVGRTGKWWCFEHYDIIPDIITAGKALQVGAVIGKDKYFPKDEKGRISGTWAEGNAIASAAGYYIIRNIISNRLLDNAAEMGEYFKDRLSRSFQYVRGHGLMIGATPVRFHDRIVSAAAKKGLLLIGCGVGSVRFLPPLNVTKHEIDVCVEILEQVNSEISKDF